MVPNLRVMENGILDLGGEIMGSLLEGGWTVYS